MKKFTGCILGTVCILFFIAGCLRKPAKRDIEANLKYAMGVYLNSPARIDTTIAKFTVLSVSYFDDKSNYQCEFKVHLKNPASDTTGIVGATISQDFSQVKRNY